MRNKQANITIFSIILAALLGAVVTFIILILMLVPLALLVRVIGG